MNDNKYSTGAFAKKANVTVRTIHHYHDKGLISPSYVAENGYRYYTDKDFAMLQKILILKNLGFSLDEIKSISLNENDADFLKNSFELQLELVRKKIAHLQFIENSIIKTQKDFDRSGEVDWDEMTKLIKIVDMDKDLVEQYKNAENIKARIDLHTLFSENKKGWFPWIDEQIEYGDKPSILEVGCGDGSFWKDAKERINAAKRVVLTDISAGMIEDAKANINNKKVEYVTADCQKLPFEDNSFDIILANHVLFYTKDISLAVKEMYRVLKKGGACYIATYGTKHMNEIQELIREFDSKIELSRVNLYNIFGLENGGAILRKKFKDVELREYKDGLCVTEVKPLAQYIMSCHGNQRELLVPKYDEFLDYISSKMKKTGQIKITKQAGIFIAKK